tara:strand:+ start:185 stop:487 length:303 start_codon:yes stop_codon:yes gene_type:complete
MNSEVRQIRYEQIFNSFVNKLKEKKPTVLSIAKAKSDANAEINLLKKQQTNEKDKNEVQEFFNEFNKLVPMNTQQLDNTINQARSAYERWLKDLNSRLLE